MTTALLCAAGTDCGRSEDREAPAESGGTGRPQIVVDVSEELLNRFVATTETRLEPVRDFILGADVYGWQHTTTHASLDLRPAENRLAAEFVIRGTTISNTVGITPQARAYSSGFHEFEACKEIIFPGDYLYTRRPRVSVAPTLRNRAVFPIGGGLPLLGPLINRYAWQQAEAQRPIAESITAHKIANPLREDFNQEVDGALTQLNQWLQRERPAWPLEAGREPEERRLFSSDAAVSFRAGFTSDADVAPVPGDAPRDVTRLAVHEAFVTEFYTRLGVAGRRFVPDDVFRGLEQALRPVEGRGAPPLPQELLFVRPTGPFGQLPIELFGESPIRVQFDGDQIRLTMQVRLQLLRDTWTPPLVIEIVHMLEVFEDFIRVTPEARLVKPLDEELRTELLILQPLIRRGLQAVLPVVHLPRTLEFEIAAAAATDTMSKSVRLRIERLSTADGWLVLHVD